MAIFKRGNVYWFEFVFSGQRIQQSTKQGSRKAAIDIESAYRTALAKGEVGITPKEKAEPIPTVGDFLSKRFLPWAQTTFSSKPQTWRYYRQGIRRINEYKPLESVLLDKVTGEVVAKYRAHRQSEGLVVSSINRELQVLRRALHVTRDWGVIAFAPKVQMDPNEVGRDRVITPVEEAKYLSAATEPLASVALTLVDSGMRPEECFRLNWENVTWTNGRYGSFKVTHGKTAAARRILPMTPRVRAVIEARHKEAGKPDEGWIWPAATRSGHIEPSSIRDHHEEAFKTIDVESAKNGEKGIRRFVLYTLRHTFLTRLGKSGCDVGTLARIAGHSNIKMSMKYVHPDDDAVFAAAGRTGIGGAEQKLLQ
jgi:integrase